MHSKSSVALSPHNILKSLAMLALQMGAPALAAPGGRRALLHQRDSLDSAPSFKTDGQTAHAFNASRAVLPASAVGPGKNATLATNRRLLASTSTFTQPLWHGEDPRIALENGNYYSVWSIGSQRVLCKSTSLIDRGSCQETPAGFPLFAPRYIGTLNGDTYNAWFAIDGNVWMNTAADPLRCDRCVEHGQVHSIQRLEPRLRNVPKPPARPLSGSVLPCMGWRGQSEQQLWF